MLKRLSKVFVRRLLKDPRVRNLLEQEGARSRGPWYYAQWTLVPPGHFYSPLPDLSLLDRESERLYMAHDDDGLHLDPDGQLCLLDALAPFAARFDWNSEAVAGRRYRRGNGFFGDADAQVLFAMIGHHRPRRIIEVGSGFSSALMLDAREVLGHPDLHLTFIEPHPGERLEKLLLPGDRDSSAVIASQVQHVPLELFDTLGRDDFLFIDSSHVPKLGSDLNHLLFRVLPRLKPGVIVHFHDIFYPWEYPADWFRTGRAWNEIYIVRAFLQFNAAFRILLFNHYVGNVFADAVAVRVPLLARSTGGSLWLVKTA